MSAPPPEIAGLGHAELLQVMPAGLIVLDLELRILWANPYVEDLSGYTLAELTDGRRLTQLTSLAGRIFMESRLQMEMAIAGRVEELALDLITPSGLRIPTMMNAAVVATLEGATDRIVVAVGRSVAKRAYEDEVPKARQAAAEAESVKADFLANVSHEIRTPLNGILGVAGALASTSLNERQRRMVEVIQSSSETLERLVSDILEVSRVEAGALTIERSDIDLQAALASVVEAARLRAEAKGLAFIAALDGLNVSVRADGIRLKQVIGNLLDNAIKFTATGEIAVSVMYDVFSETLKVEVSDTGIGFEPSQAERLFERFAQADTSITRRFGGSGLGLPIARGLVELMGGTLSAQSVPGQGSTFTVIAPLDLAPAIAAPVDRRQTTSHLIQRVLLVEDHPANQLVVRYILEAQGIDVQIAENGRLGVDAWRSGAFDLVLMDMQMPEMDGLAATRAIRLEEGDAGRRRTPLVMLSANAMEHHKAEALAAGADMHIAKPITPEALIGGMSRLVAPGRPARSNALPAACPTQVRSGGGS